MRGPMIYLATPNYRPWYHREYMIGVTLASHVFPALLKEDPGMLPHLEEGLYVCDRRDILTHAAIESGADYMMMIDADTGFRPGDIQNLIDADRDVVSGRYFYRDDSATIVGVPIGGVGDELQEMQSVGAGFLLVKRSALLRACAVVADRVYGYENVPGAVTGLWQPFLADGEQPCKDDGAFSRHCRAAGIKLWMHCGVTVPHFGEKCFMGQPVPWSGVHARAPVQEPATGRSGAHKSE